MAITDFARESEEADNNPFYGQHLRDPTMVGGNNLYNSLQQRSNAGRMSVASKVDYFGFLMGSDQRSDSRADSRMTGGGSFYFASPARGTKTTATSLFNSMDQFSSYTIKNTKPGEVNKSMAMKRLANRSSSFKDDFGAQIE